MGSTNCVWAPPNTFQMNKMVAKKGKKRQSIGNKQKKKLTTMVSLGVGVLTI
jgi:hypothetical protein